MYIFLSPLHSHNFQNASPGIEVLCHINEWSDGLHYYISSHRYGTHGNVVLTEV